MNKAGSKKAATGNNSQGTSPRNSKRLFKFQWRSQVKKSIPLDLIRKNKAGFLTKVTIKVRIATFLLFLIATESLRMQLIDKNSR